MNKRLWKVRETGDIRGNKTMYVRDPKKIERYEMLNKHNRIVRFIITKIREEGKRK